MILNDLSILIRVSRFSFIFSTNYPTVVICTSLIPSPFFIDVPVLSQERLYIIMCMCVRDIEFVYFYDFSIEFWNCSDSVIFVFHFIIHGVECNGLLGLSNGLFAC